MIKCTNCGRPYPEQGAPHQCPKCGGIYDHAPLIFDPQQVENSLPGIWRYRHTFQGLPADATPLSLTEGGTPLKWLEIAGRKVAVKTEFFNPTGSVKDRGSGLIAAFLQSRGAESAVSDSSASAAASFAAYAQLAGIHATIFLSATTHPARIRHAQHYGAEVVTVDGTPSQVTQALLAHLPESGAAYASQARLPHNLPGYATIAYEIVEQLGSAPGTVILPAGEGGLLLGIFRGFEALRRAGVTKTLPRLIGVQARACSPLWVLSTAGISSWGFVTEGETVATGLRIRQPQRVNALMQLNSAGLCEFTAVDEQDILSGRDQLARLGLYLQPAAATVYPALLQNPKKLQDPVVLILTGSGTKYDY